MNTLKRIILINSGGYSELELPCDGHVRIMGMNGHGKTTLLRAILFFYVGNNENASYGIHTTQRNFATHYLGDSPSYLIYEIQRSDGAKPFHVAVARPSFRVQFLFVDDAYDEGLYIDPSRMVRSFEAVRDALDERLVKHETLSGYEHFRQTIYGIRKGPYAVFRANPRASQQVDILPRIISGIFTVNRMDANRLKRALCCGLTEPPESLRIDLRQLSNNLTGFQRINRAVKTYINNEKTAKLILEHADRYDEFSAQLERRVRDFIARAKAIPKREVELEHLKADAEQKLASLRSEHQEKENEYRERLKKQNNELSQLEYRIKRGEKRAREYEEEDIERKAAELETLPVLRQKQAEAEAHYQALTEKYDSESKRRDELLNRLKQAKDSAIAGLQSQKLEHLEQCTRESEDLHQKFRLKREEIDAGVQEREASLIPRRRKLKAEEADLAEEWKQFHKKQEPETLLRKREERKHLQTDLDSWENRQEAILSESKLAQVENARATTALDFNREKLEISLTSEKKILDEERHRLRAELDQMEKSIASLIRRERPEWLPVASRTLARDFLFYDSDTLEAAIQSGADSPLPGLDLNTDELQQLKAVEMDPAVLQTQLTENQTARDDFAERAEQQRSVIDMKRDELGKKYRREIEKWDDEKQNLERSIRNGRNTKIDISNTITNLEAQWSNERESLERKLNEREVELEGQRSELEEAERLIHADIKERRTQLQDEEDKERQAINTRKNEHSKQIDEQVREQESKYELEAERFDTEFLKQLREKGADSKVIEEANKAMKQAAKMVNEVEGHRSPVERYEQYKREEIAPLPDWRSRRQTLKEAIKVDEKEWKRLNESFSERKTESDNLISKFGNDLAAIVRDKKEIDDFRKDSIMVEYLGLFSDDSLEPAIDYEPDTLRDLARSARSTYDRLQEIDSDGDKTTRRFLNKFDFPAIGENELGFAPISDGFKWVSFVGNHLRSFVRSNGIRHFRTLQTEQFDSIIEQIVRQVSRMEDALRQVKATARKVQEDLAEDAFIDVLDSIELRVRDESSELWNQLKRMERFQNINFGSDPDLFQQQADKSSSNEAIQAFENLVKHLERERREALELEDSFEFAIRVIENGHDHGFRASLDHIGSTGTDYLVKMLIYLSLIDLIRRQALTSDDQAYLHCILDETGVLAPKYVKEAIRYAEKKRIFLITAGHSATSTGFRYWFRVRKHGPYFVGEQIIRKLPSCK